MTSHTVYRTFNTDKRREFVRITEDVEEAVRDAGIAEGMVLVSAMHITAGGWVNDDEPGIHAGMLEWLGKTAPPRWEETHGEVGRGGRSHPRGHPPPPGGGGHTRAPPQN